MKKLPNDLWKDVGCARATIFRINQGIRQASPELAKKIILAMKERGEDFVLADIRPDLAELAGEHSPEMK